jgi:hypothetical protein
MNKMRTFAAIAAAIALQLPAAAGVLYKSIDRDGRITFSDTPVDGAVTLQRIESSDTAKPRVGADAAPVYLALAELNGEAVARANARVDTAEHALAEARRLTLGEDDPLALGRSRLSRTDVQRLEGYKRDVADARQTLLRALQVRNLAAARPLA